jgi:hypothetical protein
MGDIVKELCDFLADYFKQRKWEWSLAGRGHVTPNSEDMGLALDEAAELLYNLDVGAILEVGRLVVIKTNEGYDTYVLAGSY